MRKMISMRNIMTGGVSLVVISMSMTAAYAKVLPIGSVISVPKPAAQTMPVHGPDQATASPQNTSDSSPSVEQTIPAMPGAMSVEKIDKYNSKITELTYQSKILALQATIARSKAEIKKAKEGKTTPSNNVNPNGFPEFNQSGLIQPQPVQAVQPASAPAHQFTYPTVRSIFGINGHTQATMILPNGDAVRASPGDTLPDGIHVDRITSTGNVYVSRKGQKVLLSFGAPPVITSSSSNNNSTYAAPPQTVNPHFTPSNVQNPPSTPMTSPMAPTH